MAKTVGSSMYQYTLIMICSPSEGRMEYYRISVCRILQEIFREKRVYNTYFPLDIRVYSAYNIIVRRL